ncbi:MAG: ABC transporter ATP-binding protein [Planctomycetota bacterium]
MNWEEEERYKPFDRHLAARLYKFLWPYKWLFTVMVVLWVSWTVSMLWQPDLMRQGIDRYMVPASNGEITARTAFRGLAAVAGFILGLSIISTVMGIVRMRVGFRLGQRVLNDIRMRIFRHIQKLSMGYFDRTKAGWIIARADSDLDSLEGIYTWAPVNLASAVVTLGGAIGFMLWYNWRLAIAVSLTIPPLVILTLIFRHKIADAYRHVRRSASRITANVAENISGIRVVQSFVRQDRNLEHFDELNRENIEANVRAARIWQSYWPAMIFIGAVGTVIIIWYGSYEILSGRLDNGELFAFMAYLGMFFGPIHELSHMYNALLSSMAAGERIFGLLETEPDVRDAPRPLRVGSLEGHVVFDGVSFSYNKRDEEGFTWVLEDVSFEARSGETIALVGPTGAGKTTVVSLIARFYDIQEGRVLIDGYDVREIAQKDLHSQMGLVQQESFLFSGTVMENIKYGRLEATDDEIHEAAKTLGCYDILANLPNGFETQVGERGENLSQGQRQLVSFTRAIVADPRILMLDEATASVDVRTEMALQYALERLLERRTSFVVAHRLSTVRNADQVLVIQDGRITERGTHMELLTAGGAYARMYAEFIKA